MEKLKPSDIVDEVTVVLERANQGKGSSPCFLSAYQILDRLPSALKNDLIFERGLGGKGTGVHYSAASLVSDAAEKVEGIEIDYLDTDGLNITINNQKVEAGFEVCGIYKLTRTM